MKGLLSFISITMLLIAGCGNSGNGGSGAEGASGSATITINGEPIEVTSVSCRAQEYTYSVRASGPTHSVEVEFRLVYSEDAEDEYDFSSAGHLEVYVYQSDSTVLYRSGTMTPPSGISGGEDHATGSAEIARYNDDNDVMAVDVDIRCE